MKYDTFYEIGVLEAVKDLKLTGSVVDIGANVGNHAIYFARECGLKVYAFEPEPHHFLSLAYNLCENKISKRDIHCSPHLLSFRSGRANLIVGAQAPENVWAVRHAAGAYPAHTLDEFYNGLSQVSLIKVDTEGTEFNILWGALRS